MKEVIFNTSVSSDTILNTPDHGYYYQASKQHLVIGQKLDNLPICPDIYKSNFIIIIADTIQAFCYLYNNCFYNVTM